MGPPSLSCVGFLRLSGWHGATSGAQQDTGGGRPPPRHCHPTPGSGSLLQPPGTFAALQEFVFIFLIPPQPFLIAAKMWVLPLSDTFIQINDCLKRALASEGKVTWCKRYSLFIYTPQMCAFCTLLQVPYFVNAYKNPILSA